MQTVYVDSDSLLCLSMTTTNSYWKSTKEKERKGEPEKRIGPLPVFHLYENGARMDGADDGTTICCAAFLQIPSRVKNRRRTLLSHPNRPPPVIFVSPSKKRKRKINLKKKKKNTFQVKRHLIPARQTNKAMVIIQLFWILGGNNSNGGRGREIRSEWRHLVFF